MKKLLLTVFVCLSAAIATAQQPAIKKDSAIEEKIESLLSKTTLEDKEGQMLELNFDSFGKYDASTGEWILDEVKLDTIIAKYRIGSILNAPNKHLAN